MCIRDRIGGVAATNAAAGVVSPGGVGFDICCGVRLIASNLEEEDFNDNRQAIMQHLDERIPRGVGRGAVAPSEVVVDVLRRGAGAVVEAGFGNEADLQRCEELGRSEGADPSAISEKAVNRGKGQLGSLGAGNHFLEVQIVDEVLDDEAARVFGLSPGTVSYTHLTLPTIYSV